MNYSIIYNSKTGNTQLLAKTILDNLSKNECDYIGPIKETQSDLLFIGFCTDKGNCSEELTNYLKSLNNKKIFLFGTAGFGGSQEYFDKILDNVKTSINQSNTIIGSFMCQGKMPISVRNRYEQMSKDNPERFEPMIVNFDKALSHPDNQDLQALIEQIKKTPI